MVMSTSRWVTIVGAICAAVSAVLLPSPQRHRSSGSFQAQRGRIEVRVIDPSSPTYDGVANSRSAALGGAEDELMADAVRAD